jgi:hypothetical protein
MEHDWVGRQVHFVDDDGEVAGTLLDFDGDMGWITCDRPIGAPAEWNKYIIADYSPWHELGTWHLADEPEVSEVELT